MWAEMKHTLRRLRGQIIGWSIGLGLYSLMMAALFPTMQEMNIDEYLQYYPEEMMAFIGGTGVSMSDPVGYLDVYYFGYISIIAGVFAVGVGAKLLLAQEEKGILDLIASYPVSRSALYWGRVAGMAAAVAIIQLVNWIIWRVPGSDSMGLTWLEFLRPFIPLAAFLLLFGSLSLFLSMALPSSRMAAWIGSVILVGNYILMGLANMNADLEPIADISPLHFYQGGQAVNAIDWEWTVGLLGVALVFTMVGWLLFLRRDIRVGGEGSWRLPTLRREKGTEF